MEVTIEITQYCPYDCSYCSTNATSEGKPLSFETIKKFLLSKVNFEDLFYFSIIKKEPVEEVIKTYSGIDRINISGGEPLSHPDFYKILEFCKKISPVVKVYTNALDHIIFNSDIIKEINVEANVCITPGKSIYIPKDVETVHLLKLVHQGRAKTLPKVEIQVSSNFKEDCSKKCSECRHLLLQADGQIVQSPCTKKYEGKE